MPGTKYAKIYFQPAFLICTLVLGLSGIVVSKIVIEKEPLPLKKSLDLLDETDLAPYKVIAKEKIESEDVIKSLGTKYYLQWLLEDSDVAGNSDVRKCLLFITYYEVPDVVVHTPEQCYMGSGYQPSRPDSVTFEVNRGNVTRRIPGRYLVFERTSSNLIGTGTKFPVLYLFNVNGRYANSRRKARAILNKNLLGKYSYYSKIEWKFFNTRLGEEFYPSKEQALTASEKLLAVILPILEAEHWPDWEKQK